MMENGIDLLIIRMKKSSSQAKKYSSRYINGFWSLQMQYPLYGNQFFTSIPLENFKIYQEIKFFLQFHKLNVSEKFNVLLAQQVPIDLFLSFMIDSQSYKFEYEMAKIRFFQSAIRITYLSIIYPQIRSFQQLQSYFSDISSVFMFLFVRNFKLLVIEPSEFRRKFQIQVSQTSIYIILNIVILIINIQIYCILMKNPFIIRNQPPLLPPEDLRFDIQVEKSVQFIQTANVFVMVKILISQYLYTHSQKQSINTINIKQNVLSIVFYQKIFSCTIFFGFLQAIGGTQASIKETITKLKDIIWVYILYSRLFIYFEMYFNKKMESTPICDALFSVGIYVINMCLESVFLIYCIYWVKKIRDYVKSWQENTINQAAQYY